MFHTECIDRWLLKKRSCAALPTCPLCKAVPLAVPPGTGQDSPDRSMRLSLQLLLRELRVWRRAARVHAIVDR